MVDIKERRRAIFDRIKRAWERVGGKNAKEFSAYTKKHDCYISEGAISKWRQGESTPGPDNLIDIANLCDCDLEFLILRQSLPKKRDSTVHDMTGLSEEAIKAIQSARNVSLLQRAREGTFLIKMKDDTGIDCINWFIEEGLLPILGNVFANLREKRRYDAERERTPEIIRDITDRASKGLEGVTPGGDYDMLLRSAVLRELHPLSDEELRALSEDDYFRDLDNYKKNKYEFSEIVLIHTLPKKNCPDYREYAFPMAYLIADKEHDYMMYVRERELKTQVVINKFARLIDEYMNKDPG